MKKQDHEFRSAIGKRFKESRARTSLTLEKVGEHIGVTRNMVALWEMGKSFPMPEKLMALVELYGISVDWLLGRDRLENEKLQETQMGLRNALTELPGEEIELVGDMVRFMRERRRLYRTGLDDGEIGEGADDR